jgi:hypothetical protein
MRVQPITLIPFIAVALFRPPIAYADRVAPKPVQPVVWQGIEYRAPLDLDLMGHVQAFERSSGRKLWETKVYDVRITPRRELDVQLVFISGLQVQGGELLVTNEAGKGYRLDLKTGRVQGGMRYWLPWLLVGVFLTVLAFFAWIRIGHGQQTHRANEEERVHAG